MSTLMKPVRVVKELTPTEQYIRAIDKAREIRDAARARVDGDYIERMEEARERYLPLARPTVEPIAGAENAQAIG
jgi:hypothetical protein